MAFMGVSIKESKNIIKNLVKGWSYIAHHEVVVTNKDPLLYMHEAGVPSKNIPPRPVIHPAMSEYKTRKQLQRYYRSAMLRAMVFGDINGAEAELKKMGMAGMNACKKYITDGTHLTPNSPVTIARKGSSVPLIDTGHLVNSFDYEIRRK